MGMFKGREGRRVIRTALAGAGLLLGAVAGLAWAGSDAGIGAGHFDHYVSLGPRLGTEALNRDLNLQHPAGTSLVSLLARLEKSGFGCLPDTQRMAGYDCTWRRAVSERRVAQIKAHVEANGVQVVSIAPEVGVYTR